MSDDSVKLMPETFRRMSPRLERVLELRAQGLSHREIAEALEVPTTRAKQLLSKAQRFRSAVELEKESPNTVDTANISSRAKTVLTAPPPWGLGVQKFSELELEGLELRIIRTKGAGRKTAWEILRALRQRGLLPDAPPAPTPEQLLAVEEQEQAGRMNRLANACSAYLLEAQQVRQGGGRLVDRASDRFWHSVAQLVTAAAAVKQDVRIAAETWNHFVGGRAFPEDDE